MESCLLSKSSLIELPRVSRPTSMDVLMTCILQAGEAWNQATQRQTSSHRGQTCRGKQAPSSLPYVPDSSRSLQGEQAINASSPCQHSRHYAMQLWHAMCL